MTLPHWDDVRRRFSRKPTAHFLHIRKTGGTAIKAALENHKFRGPYQLALHSHDVKLADVPPGEKFFFALRDPVSRFVSSFYSRQRQGYPRYESPWRPEERVVFERFSTPGELAEALGSDDPDERGAAKAAMDNISHFRSYWQWFGDEQAFSDRTKDVLMVLFQDRLDDDFALLTQELGVTASLPTDDISAHRNPVRATPLSDVAVTNLRQRYQRDYHFIDLCKALRPDIGPVEVA